MTKKNITIEDLAMMVQQGFLETAKKSETERGFQQVNSRLDKVEERLENIEKLLIADHRRRIERLENDVRELKDLLAVK